MLDKFWILLWFMMPLIMMGMLTVSAVLFTDIFKHMKKHKFSNGWLLLVGLLVAVDIVAMFFLGFKVGKDLAFLWNLKI